MDPLISVIVVTYNRAHFLKDALDSIQRQTFRDYEIILVDDGSTDNTKEIVKKYEGIRYIYQAHGGISKARNTAIKAAKGKWIATLDSDDLWKEGKLQKQVDYLRAHPECRIVYTIYKNFTDIPEDELNEQQKDLLQTVINWDLPTALIDARLFDEIGLFDENLEYSEDMDWNLRLKFYKVDKSHCIEEVLYLRRVHGSNITHSQKKFCSTDMLNLAINAYRKVRKVRNGLGK
jgi:glycosyltransferase involved in cell wall biosynthesis